MNSLIKKIILLFYKYYDKGSTKAIAYESALMAMMMVVFINVFSFLIFTGVADKYFPKSNESVMWKKYVIGFTIFIPLFFLLKILFKKKDIIAINMDRTAVQKGYFIIVSYIICSVLFLIWTINQNSA